jgi:hypothetical protein
LGVGLADIQQVLADQASIADVAAAHVVALEAQIRTLRLRRAVLSTVARRRSTGAEMALMNRLARLSAQERERIIEDFLAEVSDGLDAAPGVLKHLRRAAPALPDEPAPEQVDAWVELAELVQDPQFRSRVRGVAEYTARLREAAPAGNRPVVEFSRRPLVRAGAAIDGGVAPESAAGAEALDAILGPEPVGDRYGRLLTDLEIVTDPRAERYWALLGMINGWPPYPDHVPTQEQVVSALRAHAWTVAALQAHR